MVKSKINKKKLKKTLMKSYRKKRKTFKSKKKYSKKYMNNIPKRNQFNSNREYLLYKCGMPDITETKHCFNDETHHTCCELSQESRKYADNSDNPIGKLSEEVFNQLPNEHPKKKYYLNNNKRPWCTCFGSKVCGFYADKSNQKTKIDFISSPNNQTYANNIYGSPGCEEFVRNKFDVDSHGTPGINSINSNNLTCSKQDVKKIKYHGY